jgi:hypothetical protein
MIRVNPHFSPAFYCGGGSGHVCCVALGRASRQTVKSASEALGRAPCIHARLHRLATKPGEKYGLMLGRRQLLDAKLFGNLRHSLAPPVSEDGDKNVVRVEKGTTDAITRRPEGCIAPAAGFSIGTVVYFSAFLGCSLKNLNTSGIAPAMMPPWSRPGISFHWTSKPAALS